MAEKREVGVAGGKSPYNWNKFGNKKENITLQMVLDVAYEKATAATKAKAEETLEEFGKFVNLDVDSDTRSIFNRTINDLGENDFFDELAEVYTTEGPPDSKLKERKNVRALFSNIEKAVTAYNNIYAPKNQVYLNTKPITANHNILKEPVVMRVPFMLSDSSQVDEGIAGEKYNAYIQKLDDRMLAIKQEINLGQVTPAKLKSLNKELNMLDAGKDLFIFLSLTGLRSGEALSIGWFDPKVGNSHPNNLQHGVYKKGYSNKLQQDVHQIFLPQNVTKMSNVLSVNIDDRLGRMLDKRAEIARRNGSRQLFSYFNPESGKTVEAFSYETNKANLTLKNMLFGANSIAKIPGISYSPTLGQTVDYFSAHDLRRFFASAARNWVMGYQGPNKDQYDYYVSLFQGRFSDIFKSQVEANKYFVQTPYSNKPLTAQFQKEFIDSIIQDTSSSDQISSLQSHFGVVDQDNMTLDRGEGSTDDVKKGLDFEKKDLTKAVKTVPFEPEKRSLLDVIRGRQKPEQSEFAVERETARLTAKEKIARAEAEKAGNLQQVQYYDDLLSERQKTGAFTTEQGLLQKQFTEEIFDEDIVQPEQLEEVERSLENKPSDIKDLERNTNKPKEPTVDFKTQAEEANIKGLSKAGVFDEEKPSLGKRLKLLGKNIPFLGAAVGTGIAGYYMAKPKEAFAVTGQETDEQLEQLRLKRAATEFASGVSPVPEPAALNLLNVLPGVSGINIQSAGELVAPTAEEAKARSKVSPDKPNLTTQMSNLFN
tara:strand:- start:191 stop:2488 length:2298 start_codon:yes stop_codon:yes gene_type:complete